MDLSSKSDKELDQWIHNHERKAATGAPLFTLLLEERARRSKIKHILDVEKSLGALRQAAIEQRCISYGELAAVNEVAWSQTHHRMNGANGHLDRLLDVCHARGLPMLPAICVNKQGLATGELEAPALAGFAEGARRLGFSVTDELAFHRQCRDECWEWGRQQQSA